MNLTADKRKQTGAFYTPKAWAQKSIEWLLEYLPLGLESYVFYDPAAGEGNLLQELPDDTIKFGSTIEWDDVVILKNKNINAFQFDFLNDDIGMMLPNYLIQNTDKMIVLTNPPFIKLSANSCCYAKQRYKTRDAVALFLYRIYYELCPVMIASWSKLDIWQSGMQEKFRKDVPIHKMLVPDGLKLTPSKSWGLTGDFAIAFNIFIPAWTSNKLQD